MENFKEVSLGFAEFVSQLMQETFEAILSSQSYQLDKYAELEQTLQMSNEQFAEAFISESQIEEKSLLFFNIEITEAMVVHNEFSAFLLEEFGSLDGMVLNNKLTADGFTQTQSFISNLLVEERKNAISNLLNKSTGQNLIVDSGEIIAKLELSNLYASSSDSKESQAKRLEEKDIEIEYDSNAKKQKAPNFQLKKVSSNFGLTKYKQPIKVKEITDDTTNRTTLLIDRTDIKNLREGNVSIPAVRLVAKPVTMSSGNSNLFAQIKINFKTV